MLFGNLEKNQIKLRIMSEEAMPNIYMHRYSSLFITSLTVFLTTFFSYVNATTVHPYIIGGEETLRGKHPYMTAILNTSAGTSSSFCGGSYIGGKWIVTAAHCVLDEENRKMPRENIAVNVGGHDLRYDRDNLIGVTYIWVHPRYDALHARNDIALLQIERTPENVRPVAIAGNEAVNLASLYHQSPPPIILGRGLQKPQRPFEDVIGRTSSRLFEAQTQRWTPVIGQG